MTEAHVTIEYLLSHGFRQYKSVEDGDCYAIPFSNNDYLYFREIEFHRQMFVVEIAAYLNDKTKYHTEVYVQEDAGCGFIEIPFPWAELTVECFESVYYGIRGYRPAMTPQSFVDAEYEIVKPKMIEEAGKIPREAWDKLGTK
jgi:hypothetical protein